MSGSIAAIGQQPTGIPTYVQGDIARTMQSLLPTGPVWPRDPTAVQSQVINALALTFLRNAEAAGNLIADVFPATAVDMLPEWESALGLPDPCAGESPTIQARQQQVVARLIAGGGQSTAFFISFAAQLGYTISITVFPVFRAGSTAGSPLNGEAWAHTWQVNAPEFSVEYFRAGEDAAGEPLATWGTTVLQCEFARLKPAHTVLLFSYT